MIGKISPEKCIACGLCQICAPQIFDYTEEGIVLFLNSPTENILFIEANKKSEYIHAFKRCPTRAILPLKENYA